MASKIKIEKITYFGYDETGSDNWNAKVLYFKDKKLYHAMIDIDFFSKKIYIPKNIQSKDCKVYSGLEDALLKEELFKRWKR
jgi:hypothetical protein